MGVEEIIKKIEEDMEIEKKNILEEAKKKAEKIIDQIKKEAEEKKKAVIEKGEKEAILEEQRIIADAKLRAKKLKWDVREEIVRSVFDNARKRIMDVRKDGFGDKNYSEILKGLIKEAAMSTGGKDLVVLMNKDDSSFISKKDIEDISKEINARISISDGLDTGMGGVIVRTADGRIEVDNTFEKRFERFSDTLRADVIKTLFGG
ncbi:MAG: V-type ATP synthase subunit E family protein [Candidatus Syntropharchaeia archaeon]